MRVGGLLRRSKRPRWTGRRRIAAHAPARRAAEGGVATDAASGFAIWRQAAPASPPDAELDLALRFADLELDPLTREVRRGNRSIELTPTEFSLLELLMRNPRQVLTRQVIFDRVWHFDFGPKSNLLYVYIGYLRRKTEASGEPRLIRTVRGIGYGLCEPVAPAGPRDAATRASLTQLLADS